MARTLNRLKAKQIETLGAGRHSDGGGLYLDRDEHGRSRWLFMWTRNGKRREMGLGSANKDGVSLAKARDAAGKAREVRNDGGDPIEAREAAKREPAPVPTFGEAADDFLKSLSSQWRNEKHRAQWAMTLKVYAKPLRALRVDRVDTAAVLEVLKSVWSAKSETASRLRGRIERVLDAAKANGHRSGENPARWRGHLDHLLPSRQKLTRGHHAALSLRAPTRPMAWLVLIRTAELVVTVLARPRRGSSLCFDGIDIAGRSHSLQLTCLYL